MSAQPSLAVVVARLDDVVQRLDKLSKDLEAGYVRKDVYSADRQTDAIQAKGIEDEQRLLNRRIDKMEEHGASNRRLIISSFIAPVVVGIVVVLILSALGAR